LQEKGSLREEEEGDGLKLMEEDWFYIAEDEDALKC
jgi:hypothetical protein